MKKIAAFFTALILFLAIIIAFHFAMSGGSLNANNKSFGTWNSPYKDLSCAAISQNMHKDTMLVLGSSEFRHGRKTPFHPVNAFKNKNVSLMTVGNSYNQCLNHAITLGAVENKMQKRKVVLLISAPWFYKQGVTGPRYSLRFSETSYMAFMENKSIPSSIKKYVARRNETLLKDNGAMENRVRRIDRIYVYHNGTGIDKALYRARKAYATDKDYITVKTMMKTGKIKTLRKYNGRIADATPLDWQAMSMEAGRMDKSKSHNKMYISDRLWKTKFARKYKKSKGLHRGENFSTSSEFGDLKCFLKLCKAENIEPMLVVLPVNGRWYDHTGLNYSKRAKFSNKIKKISDKYGAQVSDLSKYDYDPYFVQDTLHPWGKGWVKIDEAIYKFYRQS